MSIIKSTNLIGWIARSLSILLVGTLLFLFISYAIEGITKVNPNAQPLSAKLIIGFIIFGIGALGLVLAWKWETFGGILSLIAFTTMFAMHRQGEGNWSNFFLLPLNSIIFLVAAYFNKAKKANT
jgi:hypothetical protein